MENGLEVKAKDKAARIREKINSLLDRFSSEIYAHDLAEEVNQCVHSLAELYDTLNELKRMV